MRTENRLLKSVRFSTEVLLLKANNVPKR